MPKISYPDKQTAVNPTSPAANEIFTAANANEIKNVVNAIDDTVAAAVVPVELVIMGETPIDWQNDDIPDGSMTYAQRFGNIPPRPTAYDNTWALYNGFSVVVTWDGPLIDTVTFNADLTPTTLYL